MNLTYLQIFADKQKILKRLSDTSFCALMRAMCAYAFDGEQIDAIDDPAADALWPIFREMIDNSARTLEAKRRAGQIGGTQKAANAQKAQADGSTGISDADASVAECSTDVVDCSTSIADDSTDIAEDSKNQESRVKNQESREGIGATAPTTRVRAHDGRFDLFWREYPKRVGKAAALKAFERIRPSSELFERMLASVRQQRASPQWTRDNGQYIPNPATWLNQGRWDDEPVTAARSGAPETSNIFLQMLWEDKQNAEARDA